MFLREEYYSGVSPEPDGFTASGLFLFCFLYCARLLRFLFRCFCFSGSESFHAASHVNEFFFSGVERMALGANFNLNFGFGCAYRKRVPAGARDFCFFEIFRMNIGLHMNGNSISDFGEFASLKSDAARFAGNRAGRT